MMPKMRPKIEIEKSHPNPLLRSLNELHRTAPTFLGHYWYSMNLFGAVAKHLKQVVLGALQATCPRVPAWKLH